MENVQHYATIIVKTLVEKGYIAYFAGGWVRDFLMDHPSSDIDIATNAPPEIVVALFKKTIQVGMAFGVVIVSIDRHLFEVATFRKDIEYKDGRKPEKIELSSPEEDAYRRDFTINGMFYDPLTGSVLDYVGGKKDIEKKMIRAIGNPHDRFVEDRLRMIRAVRFAARFGFQIDPETAESIKKNASTLFPAVAMERIYQELAKMIESPRFNETVVTMHLLGLLQVIFPDLQTVSLQEIEKRTASFPRFPLKTGLVYYLLGLFPEASEEKLVEMCERLKTSRSEAQSIVFASQAKHRFYQEQQNPGSVEAVDWVYFYADTRAPLCIAIYGASIEKEEERKQFLKQHEENQKKWDEPITRIKKNRPLVNAAFLKEHGIKPSPMMGALLREAERIAIQHHFNDPEEVLEHLKESPLWSSL